MEDKKIEIYVDRIINHVVKWKDRLNLSDNFKVSDINIYIELRDKLKPYIKKILKEEREHLLTEDFCYYLVYESLKFVDYQKELLKLLDNIIEADSKELIKILHNYIFYVCFGDVYKFDKKENYINLMNKDSLSMYQTCENCISKMYSRPVKGYESTILTEILFNIYGYCVINKKYDMFDKLVSKYFNNTRQTIDHFINNGFMKKDYDLIDGFDTFLYEDMNIQYTRPVIS